MVKKKKKDDFKKYMNELENVIVNLMFMSNMDKKRKKAYIEYVGNLLYLLEASR